MAQEIINIGVVPNDSLGDPLRVAFTKINNNFSQLYTASPALGPEYAIQFAAFDESTGGYILDSSANLTFNSSTNSIILNGNIVPITTGNLSIGSATKAVGNIYLGKTALRIGNISVAESANVLDFSVSVLPTKKADINAANITVSAVIANTVSAVNDINYSNTSVAVSTTEDDSADQIIFSVPEPNMSYGKFYIKSVQTGSQNSQSVTISINKRPDGTDIKYSAYGTIFNGDPITTYDVDVSYGDIRIKVNPLVNEIITHEISCSIIN
jgi:hypothetical protein